MSETLNSMCNGVMGSLCVCVCIMGSADAAFITAAPQLDVFWVCAPLFLTRSELWTSNDFCRVKCSYYYCPYSAHYMPRTRGASDRVACRCARVWACGQHARAGKTDMFTKSQMLQLARVWMHTNIGFIRAPRVGVCSRVSCTAPPAASPICRHRDLDRCQKLTCI